MLLLRVYLWLVSYFSLFLNMNFIAVGVHESLKSLVKHSELHSVLFDRCYINKVPSIESIMCSVLLEYC